MKQLKPCTNCGAQIIYTAEGKHPCSFCGHRAPGSSHTEAVNARDVARTREAIRLGLIADHYS